MIGNALIEDAEEDEYMNEKRLSQYDNNTCKVTYLNML